MTDDGWVVAELEGFMEPIRVPLEVVEKASKHRATGWRKIEMHREPSTAAEDDTEFGGLAGTPTPMSMIQTLSLSLNTVRQQHTNASAHLFGGSVCVLLAL